jgi:hypothetical protein
LERKIKMIWDFRGGTAQRTAEHHCEHLGEYIQEKGLGAVPIGVEVHGEFHSSAYMVVEESHVAALREILKPHRGQIFTED